MSQPTRFGLVGYGWRAQYFLKLAALFPDRLQAAGVAVRRTETGERVRDRWKIPAYASPAELIAHERPDFVISSVPWAANPGVVRDLVEADVPVLSETPPAPDLDGLRALWRQVGPSGLVQVAEQYPLMPPHAARARLVADGVIGRPTSVQVSSTHLYHAVALIRGLLRVGFEPATVHGHTFAAPLVDPLVRDAWTDDDTPKDAATTIATLDFGGAMGLYDFTDNQWHNQLRARRIVIRGSHGEIVDDQVIRLAEPRTIVRSPLIRRQTGYDLDLDGYDTAHLTFEGRVVYRNNLAGLRLSDEEIAISTLLLDMAAWCNDEGPAPYPLAEACQDHLLALAIESATTSGRTITTTNESWNPE
jgi:predicted dehydrogenase